VLSLALLACDKSSGSDAPAPSASAVVAPSAPPSGTPATAPSAQVAEKPRGPGKGGIDAILFRAARDLTLTDAQKTQIDGLESKLRDRDTGPRDAMKTLLSDLATQVRAGKVDASKLSPDETAIDAATKAMIDKQATALAGLHDAIDAGQRKALADAVTTNTAAREARAKAHEGDGGDWTARRLDRLTSDLGLDAGQQKLALGFLMKQPSPPALREEMSKQMAAVLMAFQTDTFDASKALAPMLKTSHDAVDRQIAFTGQLLGVLKPEQRERFATSTMRPVGKGGPGETWSDDDDGHGGGGGGGGGGQ
jgi:hypothetical protein